MPMSMNITLADFTTFIGAIKYWQMFLPKICSTFQRHRSADIIIGFSDFFIAETHGFEQVPFKIIILFRLESQSSQTFFFEVIYVEYKSDFKCGGNSRIEFFDFFSKKSFFTQSLMV